MCDRCELSELAGTAEQVIDSIKADAWDQAKVGDVLRSEAAAIDLPLPDDWSVRITGEDVNLLRELIRTIAELAVTIGG